jgi:hypothetical protein
MAARPLGSKQDAAKDEDPDGQRGADATQIESAVSERLGEQVTHRRAERTGEDKGQPEEDGTRDLRAKVDGRDERQRAYEDQRRTFISQPRIVREKVAESGPERVRKENRRPIERFCLARDDAVDRHGAHREPPQPEDDHQDRQEHKRAADVADARRAIRKVRHRCPGSRSRDNHAPIQERMKGFRSDLSRHRDREQGEENDGAESVAQVHRHGKGISARLAQRRGGHLDDPKGQDDFGNLARSDFVRATRIAGLESRPLAGWLLMGDRHGNHA